MFCGWSPAVTAYLSGVELTIGVTQADLKLIVFMWGIKGVYAGESLAELDSYAVEKEQLVIGNWHS